MPSSSPNAAKMKSLPTYGISVGEPWPMPVPTMPPVASANHPCASWK